MGPYIGKNHKNIEKQLIIKMIQSKESLEWIVDALIRGQKIPSMKQTAYDSLGKAHDYSKYAPRIQVLRKPSMRVDKNGQFLSGSPVQQGRRLMISANQSPSRMGLQAARHDTYQHSYTSPIRKMKSGTRLTSPMSKASRATTASGKGYAESPLRLQKQITLDSQDSLRSQRTPRGGTRTAGSTRERGFSPSQQTKKMIKQVTQQYEVKRQSLVK